MDEVAQEEMKEMMFETNIYLVALTVVVSLLHTVFSTLAIKNGIFWIFILVQFRFSILAKLRLPRGNISAYALHQFPNRCMFFLGL
jgi:Cleft lip and palate transmembrane protein 1 (CLPTM1)